MATWLRAVARHSPRNCLRRFGNTGEHPALLAVTGLLSDTRGTAMHLGRAFSETIFIILGDLSRAPSVRER